VRFTAQSVEEYLNHAGCCVVLRARAACKKVCNMAALKIGFVTCSDLSRYYTEFYLEERKPYLFTHDDLLAVEDLRSRGCVVDAVVWGTDVAALVGVYDILILRSPWDYMDNKHSETRFLSWLESLQANGVNVLNRVEICKWSLDKHYLRDLEMVGVRVVPSQFVEPDTDAEPLMRAAFAQHHAVVVKPVVAAAAKDCNAIRTAQQLESFVNERFAALRTPGRAFILQPFIPEIATVGEISVVFLCGRYSHAVRKLPKQGDWRVQDELGGSVESVDPSDDLVAFAEDAYRKVCRACICSFKCYVD
jgi:hypothetical protein